MAVKDSTTKKYMSDNEVFADAFNFYIYGGEQVIKSDQLRTLDTTAITLTNHRNRYRNTGIS